MSTSGQVPSGRRGADGGDDVLRMRHVVDAVERGDEVQRLIRRQRHGAGRGSRRSSGRCPPACPRPINVLADVVPGEVAAGVGLGQQRHRTAGAAPTSATFAPASNGQRLPWRAAPPAPGCGGSTAQAATDAHRTLRPVAVVVVPHTGGTSRACSSACMVCGGGGTCPSRAPGAPGRPERQQPAGWRERVAGVQFDHPGAPGCAPIRAPSACVPVSSAGSWVVTAGPPCASPHTADAVTGWIIPAVTALQQ